MFTPPDSVLFYSKNDAQDLRYGDLVKNQTKLENIKPGSFLIYSYADDRGVKNNGGRIGASEGPDVIRSLFYKMTNSPLKNQTPKLCDIGNLQLSSDIFSSHERAIQFLSETFTKDIKIISLGGGHDYSYPDGKLFLGQKNTQKTLIINFDAHLDCRPFDTVVNSGTPFYRLLDEHHQDFIFLEVGLQKQCNSKAHYEWAKQKGLRAIWYEDIVNSEKNLCELIADQLSDVDKGTECYTSIDLDAFSSAYAPGCSQSWPTGLHPKEVLNSLDWVYANFKVKNLGIYEYAPRLDLDHRTARLAAKLMHHFIDSHI